MLNICTLFCVVKIIKCFSSFYILLIPFGKFGPPDMGKATAAARAALPSPTIACRVFFGVSCFNILRALVVFANASIHLCSGSPKANVTRQHFDSYHRLILTSQSLYKNTLKTKVIHKNLSLHVFFLKFLEKSVGQKQKKVEYRMSNRTR